MGKIYLFTPRRELIGERDLVEAVGALVIREVVLAVADICASSFPFWKFLACDVQC